MITELIGKRDRRNKTFRMEDGSEISVGSDYPIHYMEGGLWVEINIGWERRGDEWHITGAPYELVVPVSGIRWWVKPPGGREFRTELVSAFTADAVPSAHRLFWPISDDLEIYLVPHTIGVTTHYVLRGPDAPREFEWRESGDLPMTWMEGGRDNLDRSAPRKNADTTRLLEIRTEKGEGSRTIRWTGRVIKLDSQRRRTFSGDVTYPARMMH